MSAPKDSPFMQNADEYIKDNPKLKPTDVQAFNLNRATNYKTTIAICAIYGSFALFLLLIVLFSPTGSEMLTEELRTFVFTFIIGIIIVIMLIIIQVVYQKPYEGAALPFDGNMCPDYWKLVETTDAELNAIDPNITAADKSLMQYKCVPPSHIATTDFRITSNAAPYTTYRSYFGTGSPAIFISSNSGSNINCQKTFPQYMMTKSLNDEDNNPGKQANLYACAYSQACGVPWSSMCPNGSA
jgi:hypothetical protein